MVRSGRRIIFDHGPEHDPDQPMSQIVERLQDVQQRVSELLADRAQLRERISRIGSSEREHERQIEVLHVRIAELEKENEELRD